MRFPLQAALLSGLLAGSSLAEYGPQGPSRIAPPQDAPPETHKFIVEFAEVSNIVPKPAN